MVEQFAAVRPYTNLQPSATEEELLLAQTASSQLAQEVIDPELAIKLYGRRDRLCINLPARPIVRAAVAAEYGLKTTVVGDLIAGERFDEDLDLCVGLERFGINPKEAVADYLREPRWRDEIQAMIPNGFRRYFNEQFPLSSFIRQCYAAVLYYKADIDMDYWFTREFCTAIEIPSMQDYLNNLANRVKAGLKAATLTPLPFIDASQVPLVHRILMRSQISLMLFEGSKLEVADLSVKELEEFAEDSLTKVTATSALVPN